MNKDDNSDYLREFSTTFENAVIDLIDHAIEEQKGIMSTQNDSLGGIYSEVLEHSNQVAAKLERFHGREASLRAIKDYIQSDSNQMFVVYGESGCGKTSIMAKAAGQVRPVILIISIKDQYVKDNHNI